MSTEVAEVRTKRAPKSRWPLINVNQKMVINFLVILLVAVANVTVVQTMLRDLNGVAETVGQAGKLRVLSQQIAFETSLVLRLEGHRKEQVVATVDAFEMHLSGLERGDNVFDAASRSRPGGQLSIRARAVQHALSARDR